MLKHGIRLHGLESCDRIWLTCCALHNLLLDEDGLSTVWEAEANNNQSFAIQRLNNPSVSRDTDISGMGFGNDCVLGDGTESAAEVDPVPVSNTGRIRVNELSMDVMRHSLIRHFNIAFLRNEVKWTTRNNK